jgi:Flp pilus assembly protein TadD
MQYAPDDARPCSLLGKLLARQGQHASAAAQFREALRLKPGHASAQVGLAGSLWELGDQSAAIAELRSLRRQLPNLTDANLLLARFLTTTTIPALRSPAEAAVLAQKTIDAQKGQQCEAWEVLALCLAELGRWDEAARSLDKAIALTAAHGQSQRADELRAWQVRLRSYVIQSNDGLDQ